MRRTFSDERHPQTPRRAAAAGSGARRRNSRPAVVLRPPQVTEDADRTAGDTEPQAADEQAGEGQRPGRKQDAPHEKTAPALQPQAEQAPDATPPDGVDSAAPKAPISDRDTGGDAGDAGPQSGHIDTEDDAGAETGVTGPNEGPKRPAGDDEPATHRDGNDKRLAGDEPPPYRDGNGKRQRPCGTAYLVLLHTADETLQAGAQIALSDEAVLGRTDECEIVVDDPFVAQRHAKLVRGRRGYVLSDLKTDAGTFCNGARVRQETVVDDGDRIIIGNTAFVFHTAHQGDSGN